VDVVIRDGDHAGIGGDRHLPLGGSDQTAGEAAMAVARLTRAHAHAAAREPAEVVGLRQRALAPG
jgi:hypothetical protein